MRGRLIFPVKLRISQLDTEATESYDPDGAGPLTSGYDDIFGEPVIEAPSSSTGGAPRGTFSTQYKTPIFVPAQFEDDSFDEVTEMMSGSSPNIRFTVVMHFSNLEALDLVDPDGRPSIKPNDKILSIHNNFTETLIETMPTDRDIIVTEVTSASMGLTSYTRNLLLVTFEDREISSRTF